MLASNGEKVGHTNNVPRGKGTNREKATLTDLTLEALVNRTVGSVGRQTMPDLTVGPNVTINLRNPVAKSENKTSIRYLRDTTSTPKRHTMTK